MSEPTLQDDINIWLDNYRNQNGSPMYMSVLAEMQNEFGIPLEDARAYYRAWVNL